MPIEAKLALPNYVGDVSQPSLSECGSLGLPVEDPAKRLDQAKGVSTGFMVASGGDLSEGYVHDGPGVCLGDGQTEAEIPSQGGRFGCFGVCPHT